MGVKVNFIVSIQLALTSRVWYLFFVIALVNYIISGLVMFFYWGQTGVRGLFYLSELVLCTTAASFVALLCTVVRYGVLATWRFGTIFLTDTMSISCLISVDLLSLICGLLVICLTIISLTFGIEYLANEPVAHNTIVTMLAFSACIVWFIFAYDFGFMIIIWEMAGFFSIVLIESYYTRIRTTQAVTRTFVISRFSDYCLLLAVSEAYSACQSLQLQTILSTLANISAELVSNAAFLVDFTVVGAVAMTVFAAAAAKCAQFVLYVWLPDAMEAPTPASALIHSSTLVVMGIFMVLRFGPVYNATFLVNFVLLVCGSITVVYGAIASVQTGDLKKAVAYSTISQVGYLVCGCGMLALKETLIYLLVHAICKAMLFVFVGYTVHIFGGTTSLRRMGGVYAVIPHITIYVFTLCLILMGYPFTIGFTAKELLVSKVFELADFGSYIAALCWCITIAVAPLYLYRICVLPYFGTTRCSACVYRSIANVTKKYMHFAIMSFDIEKMSNPLVFFSYEWKDLTISSRATGLLHFVIMVSILFVGEFIFYLVIGVFNTDGLFGFTFSEDAGLCAATSLLLNAATVSYKVQLYTVIALATATTFFAFNACSFRASYLVAAVVILLQLHAMFLPLCDAVTVIMAAVWRVLLIVLRFYVKVYWNNPYMDLYVDYAFWDRIEYEDMVLDIDFFDLAIELF